MEEARERREEGGGEAEEGEGKRRGGGGRRQDGVSRRKEAGAREQERGSRRKGAGAREQERGEHQVKSSRARNQARSVEDVVLATDVAVASGGPAWPRSAKARTAPPTPLPSRPRPPPAV